MERSTYNKFGNTKTILRGELNYGAQAVLWKKARILLTVNVLAIWTFLGVAEITDGN